MRSLAVLRDPETSQPRNPDQKLVPRPRREGGVTVLSIAPEPRLAHLVFLDLEGEPGGADALVERPARGPRRLELTLEARDLAAQPPELRLSTGRRRADEDEPQTEERGGAAQAAQKESTASSSDSMTSNTVTSCVICRMSLTLGGRPTSLSLPPRLVTVV